MPPSIASFTTKDDINDDAADAAPTAMRDLEKPYC